MGRNNGRGERDRPDPCVYCGPPRQIRVRKQIKTRSIRITYPPRALPTLLYVRTNLFFQARKICTPTHFWHWLLLQALQRDAKPVLIQCMNVEKNGVVGQIARQYVRARAT